VVVSATSSCLHAIAGIQVPQLVELTGKRRHQASVVGDDNVLTVVEHCLASPIERAVDQKRAIDDGELVVHMEWRVVSASGNASSGQTRNVRALSLHLVVVRDDAHRNTSLMCCQQLIGNLIAGDGEHAHIDRVLGLAQCCLQLVE
jgi:hypothetical protein